MRLAELVGTMSIAADAAAGMPDGHALRGAAVAVRLAERLGVEAATARDAYYLPLLSMAGCSADAHVAASVLGDEVKFGEEVYGVDVGRMSEALPVVLRMARQGKSPLAGLWANARVLLVLGRMGEVSRAHCEVAVRVAEQLGFDTGFRTALFQAFERWDGTGVPERVKGAELPLALRIAHVAVDANVGHRLGGVDGAIALTKERAGRGLDPELVERFSKLAVGVCSDLEHSSPFAAAMAVEPAPQRVLSEAEIDTGLQAFAHFADLKSRFTTTHSTGVSELACAAARQLGFSEEEQRLVRRAALLHDVGRVAVTAAIWDKVEPLTEAERERVRFHTYAGERILSRAPAFSKLAELATLAHERFDDSGYHRRLPAAAQAPLARLLAAADVLHALGEPRPHRNASTLDRSADELSRLARTGVLCPEAVRAVLAAVNHVVRPGPRPSGLTDREVQVLDLVASGLTNKEIASRLQISVKTAGHHVQHVLEKLGVRTRAAATMLAMQRGLVTRRV